MNELIKLIAKYPMHFAGVGLAALVGIGYISRKGLQIFDEQVSKVTAPLAEAIVSTRGIRAEALGQVELPRGEIISFDEIVKAGSKVDSNFFFSWQGVRYQITGRLPNGRYGSVRA